MSPNFTFSAISFCLLLTWPLLKLHVAVVHDGTCELVDGVFLLLSEAQHVKGALWMSSKEDLIISADCV